MFCGRTPVRLQAMPRNIYHEITGRVKAFVRKSAFSSFGLTFLCSHDCTTPAPILHFSVPTEKLLNDLKDLPKFSQPYISAHCASSSGYMARNIRHRYCRRVNSSLAGNGLFVPVNMPIYHPRESSPLLPCRSCCTTATKTSRPAMTITVRNCTASFGRSWMIRCL